jgi:uncharacterized Zn-binding protein involved in type VI secretion
MAIPMVAGDTAGLFQPPGTPPPPPFSVTAVSGSSKVRFNGLPVMLLTSNTCSSVGYGTGSLTGVSAVSTKVRVEGEPVLLGGASVAAFGSIPGAGATITASGATNISVS